MMRFEVITLFPEFFGAPLATGLVGKAIESGAAAVGFVDPRAFTHDRHRTVDDTPYGGGGGMVMKPEPLASAIEAARAREGEGPVLLMSPQGRPLAQADFVRWAKGSRLVLVAGRYEGFDERVRALCDEEISLGDFVLTGGEYAALVIIDGVVRLLPGTLGNEASASEDSFSEGLLEFPHYTRPAEFRGQGVPEVLLSGDHAKIAAWRRARSLERTRARRPDLLRARGFELEARKVLANAKSSLPPIELAVILEDPGALEHLLRLELAYELRTLHVVLAPRGASRSLSPARPHPSPTDATQSEASLGGERVRLYSDLASFVRAIEDRRASLVVAAASADAPTPATPVLSPAELTTRARRSGSSLLLILGPGCPPALADAHLPSVRAASPSNALPLPLAAAILLDRLIGEG